MFAQRYMHRYGATNEDFGRYTVVARRHAATNPHAWFHGRPITLEDHQLSRWIVEPVRACSTAARRATAVSASWSPAERARDLAQPPA